MVRSPSLDRSRPRLVLSLSRTAATVRWETRTTVRCARVACGEDPQALARAALEACAAVDAPPGACTVVLGPGLVEQQLVELPALGPQEAAAVVGRRAAQLLGGIDPSDVHAAAWRLGRHGPAGEGEGSWLVVAARRSTLVPLFQVLRRGGFRVQRAAPSMLAAMAEIARDSRDERRGSIVVVAEPEATGVALIAAGELLHVAVLAEATGAPDEAVGLRLVQELRQLGAFWRRRHPATDLVRVRTVGLSPAWIELLSPALYAALGGVEVEAVDPGEQGDSAAPRAESEGDAPRSGTQDLTSTAGSLAAAARGARAVVDLRPALPPRPSRLLAAAVLLVAGTAAVGARWFDQWSGRAAAHRAALAEHERLAAGLGRLEAAARQSRDARGALAAELGRLQEVTRQGLELGPLLSTVFAATAGRTQLQSLSLDEATGRFELSGSTAADLTAAELRLGALQRELAAGGALTEVRLSPAASVPEATGSAELPFQISARLREAVP
jgi:hypothetical protein